MRSPSNVILQNFLNKCPQERRAKLLQYLPLEEKTALLAETPPAKEFTLNKFSSEKLVDNVHYSWFLPILKTYSAGECSLFLAALESDSQKSLKKILEIPSIAVELSSIGKSFLREILLKSLIGEEDRLLPIEYLPDSPINILLHLSKQELLTLINHLALYDLASELRQIVETKMLKKIYSFLTDNEKHLLKKISLIKEPFILARMGLERWDGKEASLKTLLHKRGITRLALALSHQHPDFVWYVCHQLDIGRGNTLFKLCEKKVTPTASESMIADILELIEKRKF